MREGEAINVNGQPRTIALLGEGPAFFDPTGDNYTFRATFSDNSLGFFSAPVPEPAAAMAAGMAATIALLRRRRQQRH